MSYIRYRKQIDFIFNFQLSIFNYQIYGFKLQRVPSDQPYQERRAGESVPTAQINGELSLKQLSRRVSMQTTVSRADVVAVLISTVENLLVPSKRGNRWISANWVNSGSISSTRVRRVLKIHIYKHHRG